VVGHDDEGVEFVEAFGTIVLQRFEEECGVGFDLKESAAVVGDCCDEEGAGVGGSRRVRHLGILANFRRKGMASGAASKSPLPAASAAGEGKQFGRYAFGFTPAFGREVRAFARFVYGPVETGPFRVVPALCVWMS